MTLDELVYKRDSVVAKINEIRNNPNSLGHSVYAQYCESRLTDLFFILMHLQREIRVVRNSRFWGRNFIDLSGY